MNWFYNLMKGRVAKPIIFRGNGEEIVVSDGRKNCTNTKDVREMSGGKLVSAVPSAFPPKPKPTLHMPMSIQYFYFWSSSTPPISSTDFPTTRGPQLN